MKPSLSAERIAGAALVVQPFTLHLLGLLVLARPTDAMWSRADPILVILPRTITLALVPLLGIAAATFWMWRAKIDRAARRTAITHAAIGAVVAIALAGVGRLVVGPHLPSFVPPEESAGPGPLLGEMAGYAEEVIFRLGVLPLAFGALARRMPPIPAALVASLVVGLSFAFLHAAGSPVWSWPHFATRAIVPGIAMSLAALAISPSFVASAHCTAHVVIPFLFV